MREESIRMNKTLKKKNSSFEKGVMLVSSAKRIIIQPKIIYIYMLSLKNYMKRKERKAEP